MRWALYCLQGQHTGCVFHWPQWRTVLHAQCCGMQQNGHVGKCQHLFVLLPSLCISSVNTTITKVSMERPVGSHRDGVGPSEVLMNISDTCQPHYCLKSASALFGGWVSVFVALCKEHSNQSQCPRKKSFRYNNWWWEPMSAVASYWPVGVLDQALPHGHFQRQLFW